MTAVGWSSAVERARSCADVGGWLLRVVVIDYTNHRGQRRKRRVHPLDLVFGANEWHADEQWQLLAHDIEKDADRYFAMANIHAWAEEVEE